jgi:hypothetical protein
LNSCTIIDHWVCQQEQTFFYRVGF